jgi:hypothetical protein
MKESVLIKEFSKSTVQRMRNIISGNAGDKTKTQTGWEKLNEDRKEGDVWEENGKTWTIKSGIKQSVTKLDRVKKLAKIPLACPKCNKHLKLTEANKKMYRLHEMCLDCVIERDTNMKIKGEWQDYESKIMNANKDATFNDFESALESWMEDNDSFVTENGDVENWTSADKTKIYEQIKSYIEKAKNTKI